MAFLFALPLLASAFPMSAGGPRVVKLPVGATGSTIQSALDSLPASGGAVVLPAGNFEVSQPIVLQRDHLTLRGSGPATVLRLADGANCPVIILGEPDNGPTNAVQNLCVSDLFIDGNRSHQQRELWRLQGEGSEIRNNGITVQNVNDSTVENVICARCRSGGLVTTRDVRNLTVRNFTAFDNEFDGLACYQTTDCFFADLNLHDNPGAGISLDLDFDHNVISNAVLTANDLGIFMRSSRDNKFEAISIRGSRHFGVFMAQAVEPAPLGWRPAPGTECADNSFANLIADNCGAAAFRINDAGCTNNIIVSSNLQGNAHGGLSLAQPAMMAMAISPAGK